MLGDAPVIDALVHGFGRSRTSHTAEEMVSVCFAESHTDIAAYHLVRRLGPMPEGARSQLELGLRFRDVAGPGRVRVMAGLSNPYDTRRSIDELDELIDEHGVVGLELYPYGWEAPGIQQRGFLFDDEHVVFPLLEHVRNRGIGHVAVDMAVGHVGLAFGVAAFAVAVEAFPDVQFEVVPSGWDLPEDTANLATRANVWINLGGTSTLLESAPRRFAEIMGKVLQAGGTGQNAEDRILWGTGVMAVHSQFLLDMFWSFEMPHDLTDDCGHPELTKRVKRKILGENYARKFDLSLDELIGAIPDDDMRQAQLAGDLRSPWFGVR